ncbi:hypothetical protein PIB30_039561 [Stylosanthes scabra]|uniref:Uncharacterized protein n=1 Tax=Stylosanthes scabra TaxID=79078 RepID=A0ABU6UD04_9FABA|nr:hypothetical protein [Stylosanthes scabra]
MQWEILNTGSHRPLASSYSMPISSERGTVVEESIAGSSIAGRADESLGAYDHGLGLYCRRTQKEKEKHRRLVPPPRFPLTVALASSSTTPEAVTSGVENLTLQPVAL